MALALGAQRQDTEKGGVNLVRCRTTLHRKQVLTSPHPLPAAPNSHQPSVVVLSTFLRHTLYAICHLPLVKRCWLPIKWYSPSAAGCSPRTSMLSAFCRPSAISRLVKCYLIHPANHTPRASCYRPSAAFLPFCHFCHLLFAAGCSPRASCYRPSAAILPFLPFAIRCWLFTTRVLLPAFGHFFAVLPFLPLLFAAGCSPHASRHQPFGAFFLFCYSLNAICYLPLAARPQYP